MLLTYQYRLQPTPDRVATLSHWGELLRRHWNYALGQRLDYLRRTRSSVDRCSLISEPIGEIPHQVDYYSQAADLKETKSLFPEYKNIYADCQQQNCGVSLDRDLNESLNVLKRTVGQPFAACRGLVDAQPLKQELLFVSLRSPRQTR